MSSQNVEVFCGETFVFKVEGADFTVHWQLIKRISEALAARMKEGWLESVEKKGALEDIDRDTFSRFVEFLYTGDYNSDEASQPPKAESVERDVCENDDALHAYEEHGYEGIEHSAGAIPAEPVVMELSWGGPEWSPRPTRKKGKKGKVFDPSDSSTNKLAGPTTDVAISPLLCTSSIFASSPDTTLNYLPLLLSHAKLYVFGNKYRIATLQKLAANRLDKALQILQPPNAATDIAQLVRYVFDNTPSLQNDEDILRAVVTNYAANNIETLRTESAFVELVEKEGDFAPALVARMCDRFLD